jgi:uncharacterized protein (UPF0332 family)
MGDTIGAVNRAYYAMFDLARAALRDIDPKLAVAKKHATIIARFSLHLVRERGFPQELGRALRRAFDARLLADYSDIAHTQAEARAIVDAMERFVVAVEKVVGDERTDGDD